MNAFSTMILKSTKRKRLCMDAKKVLPASSPHKSPLKGKVNSGQVLIQWQWRRGRMRG